MILLVYDWITNSGWVLKCMAGFQQKLNLWKVQVVFGHKLDPTGCSSSPVVIRVNASHFSCQHAINNIMDICTTL